VRGECIASTISSYDAATVVKCGQHAPLSTQTMRFVDDTIDLLWRKVLSLEQSSRKKYPYFNSLRYPNFLTTGQDMWNKASMPNFQKPTQSVQSFRYNTGCRRTGRHDDNIYLASIASRGKTRLNTEILLIFFLISWYSMHELS